MLVGIAAASGMLFFLLPYLLWSLGIIPRYRTATLIALALVVGTLFAGDWYLGRLLKETTRSAEDDDGSATDPSKSNTR
jgi:hypothetical protein